MDIKKMIEAARAKAAAAVDKQKTLWTLAEKEARALTEAEQTEFDAQTKAVDDAEKEIGRLEKMLENETKSQTMGARTIALPEVPAAVADVTRSAPSEAVRAQDLSTLTGAQRVGLAGIASAMNKQQPRFSAFEHLERMEGGRFKRLADEGRAAFDAVNKVFAVNVSNTADNLIYIPLSTDFIEVLRNESIFMRGGPVNIDMPLGALKIPGGIASSAASYVALGADFGYREMITRQVSLSAKHLRALTAIDNFSAKTSPLAIASIVGDDLRQNLVTAMDSAGLRGDGTGSNPSGVYTLMGSGQRFAQTAATSGAKHTVAQVETAAYEAVRMYRTSNVPRRRPAWLMSNRSFIFLASLRDGNGNYVYPGLQLASPVWLDAMPVLVSEQVPSNLGGGTNESQVYIVDFGHVLVGMTTGLQIESSSEATYVNASAATVSAFSRDQTVIRAQTSHDFGLRHVTSAVCITGVMWGLTAA